jgi:hypothetical protein
LETKEVAYFISQ